MADEMSSTAYGRSLMMLDDDDDGRRCWSHCVPAPNILFIALMNLDYLGPQENGKQRRAEDFSRNPRVSEIAFSWNMCFQISLDHSEVMWLNNIMEMQREKKSLNTYLISLMLNSKKGK